ncbi:sugar ABC transporter substrate-binding protein [Anaerocolumna sp. AGMB13020]|uniref:sugar ABC transporter substrate-binding protein n=1 Tax=Anaerocolumna sp. AGMB13020 TaxID=3081750 RepID=UPI00295435A1|nr:sugar ABC transporter substrate-binding protein [Anaerocolumna sp. AGMB13020]WOO38305.1 sugar ABC transporter substrate-binding protein [Anaerocolumna sp. AGMB13020]
MRKRKLVKGLLAVLCVLSLAVTGCSKGNNAVNNTPAGTNSQSGTDSSTTPVSGEIDHSKTLTLEVYDVAANYQGMQSGWFAKVIKDKFNLELNIIAPQASGNGEALYQTRTAAGKLGDIILLDNSPLQDCIKAGLIADISSDVQNSTNLNQYYDQYKTYNAGLEGNSEGKIYGMPCQITNTSPTTYSDTEVYISPMLPWDYYTEIGSPEMKNLEDLLDVLQKIQTAHPANDAGDANYAFSLWPDWDKGGTQITMETATQLTKMYGYEVNGSIMLGNNGDIKEVIDDDGAYYKMLKFFFDANQRGLVDPDSGTQNWDTACTKMKNKQVLLFWYSWQRGFWNTPDRANERNAYIYTPVEDMNFYQPSDSYYGDGRAFALGAHMEGNDRARAIEFLDWLISPEGLQFIHDGIPDWSYTKGEDGKYTLTEDGLYGLMENRTVPDEWGGGGFDDGNSKINQWPLHSVSINPNTKEPYNSNYWSSYLEANKTTMTKEWSEKYGAANQVALLESTGQLKPVPNVNIILPSDTTDVALIRSQCASLICDTSWRMVFAGSEEEFQSMWTEMKTMLEGLDWKQLVDFDKAKFQKVIEARQAAVK